MRVTCCNGEPAARRFACLLPSALFWLLPKCPICLAALMGATVSVAGAEWLRAVAAWIAIAAAIAAIPSRYFSIARYTSKAWPYNCAALLPGGVFGFRCNSSIHSRK